MSAVIREPYIVEWYPEDEGYASLAIHAFDVLSGTLDGINSAGLVVSIMADEEAMAALGPHVEPHLGSMQVTGLHELQVMRWLLDTCATAEEAKEALLTVKQYYFLVRCHYIVADQAGNSFIYENSTGRNVQHVIDGVGKPQVVTNFQVHKHPNSDALPAGTLTFENNAFWRCTTTGTANRRSSRTFHDRGSQSKQRVRQHPQTACDGKRRGREECRGGCAESRTLWHSLYDQHAKTVEFSFYLGEVLHADGTRAEHRSDYLKFTLAG